jgi:hemerythrin-like metal-binding protein
MKWTDALSVSVDQFDEQHKQLIGLLNKFYSSIMKGDSHDSLLKLLTSLEEYTIYHFREEEELMQKYNYPGIKEHLAAHKVFVDKVIDLKEKVVGGNTVISSEVTTFIKRWIEEHIMKIDKKYGEFFKNKGLKKVA